MTRLRLPLFPLGTVLFPGMALPLHVFEPRYRDLVRDLLQRPTAERELGVVAIRAGSEVGDGARALHEVGCSARVQSVTALPDGRSELLTTGARRFRLIAVDGSARSAYLTGIVEWLPERPVGDAGPLAHAVAGLFADYQRLVVGSASARPWELADDPAALSHLVAAAMVLPPDDKQRLLGAEDAAARLAEERWLLRREIALVRELGALPALDLARAPVSPH